MRKLLVLLIFGSWATMSWAWGSPSSQPRALGDGFRRHRPASIADSSDGFAGMDRFSWSPDSGRMVSSGLFVIDVETGALTDLGSGRGPNWSPVGDQIVFSDTTSTQSLSDESSM